MPAAKADGRVTAVTSMRARAPHVVQTERERTQAAGNAGLQKGSTAYIQKFFGGVAVQQIFVGSIFQKSPGTGEGGDDGVRPGNQSE